MPISWEKLIPHRPQMLDAAKGWYDRWRGSERSSANDGVSTGDGMAHTPPFEDGADKVEAYAEPIKIEDVVEVKETTKDVASRLEALEFAGMAQAETLKNLADQNQTVTRTLSELQHELGAVDRRLEEARADAEGHRTTLESLEMQLQKLAGDISRQGARINMALWVGGAGVVGAIAAIVIAVWR